MRVVSVHPDALVLTSRLWQTTATALRAGGEALLIDSPYFPDELQLLPGVLRQAGFEPNALLATHADFDHMLGRLAFPGLSLGVVDSTMERLRREPGAAQRDLRDHDARFYVERSAPLTLGHVQSLPAPGRLELGDRELELHPAEGHTSDGTAVLARFCGVLVCGDYLSDVEIPVLSSCGSLEGYRATLRRLAPILDAADTVVPGHGRPQGTERAREILEEDMEYLEALERREPRPRLPRGRDSAEQRRIHGENLERVR